MERGEAFLHKSVAHLLFCFFLAQSTPLEDGPVCYIRVGDTHLSYGWTIVRQMTVDINLEWPFYEEHIVVINKDVVIYAIGTI